MRKADLVNAISEKTNLQKVDVLVILEAFFSEVKDSMAAGNNVYVRGFGSFVIKKRARKIGRNIKHNKAIEIPEHYIPSFKPAPTFMDYVRTNVTHAPDSENDED
jgi:DNA-binding protein HU-beta